MSAESTAERTAVAAPKRRTTTNLQAKQARLAWILLSPTLLGILLIAFWPLVQTIYQSFTNAAFNSTTPTELIGLKNYQNLMSDTEFWQSVWHAVEFAIVTVIFEFILGMVIALVVNSNFPGRGVTRAAMLIPWAIITVVSAQMWKFMFSQTSGVINDLFMRLHLISSPQAWLAQPGTNFLAVCAVDIWKTTPFVALLLLAGLQVIPGDVYEAARVDGASGLQRFIQITLPLLRPAILVTLIFRTLDALRVFDVFYVMQGVNPSTITMAIYNYQNLIPFGDYGYGSAISVAIFIIIGIFVAGYVTFLKVEQT